MTLPFDPAIFRDYDIRGIYKKQLDEKSFYLIGKALAVYLAAKEIAVGFDARLSSPSLFKSLTDGIRDGGVNVVNLGLISTEIHYFASGKYSFPANVIVSASHNPPQYNGLKIVTKGVVPLHGGYGLPEIKALALKGKFETPPAKGAIRNQTIIDEWVSHALGFVEAGNLKPLKVVVDAGNGMGGISWEKVKSRLPLTIIPLYFEPDGHFPHHLPDPIDERNLADIKKKIVETRSDAGFAIDGDADRLFVLDNRGEVLSGTVTTAILAKHLLEKKGKAAVLYNVVCGKIVPQTIESLGGKPVRVRVGHSFIKETMKKEDALFAGEHSGHFYFRDNFYADSSLIAGLLFLEFLSKADKPLSSIRPEFEIYPSSGEINYEVQDAQGAIESLARAFPDASSQDTLDGISVFYPDWWFNLRASKTEPLLRLNLEAGNAIILNKKLNVLEEKLASLGAVKK